MESEAGKGCPRYISEVSQESTGSRDYYFGLVLHFHSTPVSPCIKYFKDFYARQSSDSKTHELQTSPLFLFPTCELIPLGQLALGTSGKLASTGL